MSQQKHLSTKQTQSNSPNKRDESSKDIYIIKKNLATIFFILTKKIKILHN